MISKEQFKDYPLIEEVFEFLESNYLSYSKTYRYILDSYDEEYLNYAEEIMRIIESSRSPDSHFDGLINAFIRYSHEYLVLQTKLNRNGKYLYSSFEEVNRHVYQNKRMNEYYLDGLMLSQFLWVNHYEIGKFFIQHKNLTNDTSVIMDIPAGTGIFSYHILKYFKFRKTDIYDISSYSIKYTKNILLNSELNITDVTFKIANVFELESTGKYDFICCGELLEHLEQPALLLSKLRDLLKDDGKLFLTTAIYAAAIDHIYLFENVEQVRELLNEHFLISSELILPTTLETYDPKMNKVPINYACLLGKKHEII